MLYDVTAKCARPVSLTSVPSLVSTAPASDADEKFDRGPEGRLPATGSSTSPIWTETGEFTDVLGPLVYQHRGRPRNGPIHRSVTASWGVGTVSTSGATKTGRMGGR